MSRMHTLRLMCSPTVHILQVSIPWHYSGSYCSVAGAVIPVVSVLAKLGSVTGEGVRDRGVRELCLDVSSCDVTVGAGVLRLLDTLASSLPSICVLRSWSAGA